MNVSAVGAPAAQVAAVHLRPAVTAPAPSTAQVAGTDSDGDNDGSKGANVDVRA